MLDKNNCLIIWAEEIFFLTRHNCSQTDLTIMCYSDISLSEKLAYELAKRIDGFVPVRVNSTYFDSKKAEFENALSKLELVNMLLFGQEKDVTTREASVEKGRKLLLQAIREIEKWDRNDAH